MRPLPGVPGVAAAAALLLLLLPRARADEHEHTVRGVAGRRCRPGPASPSPRSPLGQAWRGLESPAAGLSPAAVQRRLPVGPAEQERRELGGGISVRSRTRGLHVRSAWASFPRPELNSAPLRVWGIRGPGQDRGEGLGSLRRRGGGPRQRGSG